MTAQWQKAAVASDGTHHVVDGEALYDARFLEVLAFHEPGLAPVLDASGSYHIGPTGSPAYPRRFRRTFGFYEGLAAAEDASGARHVDLHGEEIGNARFSWCGNFQAGRCAVRNADGLYLHLRPDGAPAYAERWRYAGDFREGAAVVLDALGLHQHIDAEGRALGTGRFLDLDVFHKGFARARDGDGWFHIRRDGGGAYGRRFAAVEPFYNGQSRCETFDGHLVVIDETGRDLVALRGELAAPTPAGRGGRE